jgi:hypothetical protein
MLFGSGRDQFSTRRIARVKAMRGHLGKLFRLLRRLRGKRCILFRAIETQPCQPHTPPQVQGQGNRI